MARVREIEQTRRIAIDSGWTVQATAAGAVVDPAELARISPEKVPAAVPGTVAGALRAAGRWSWTTNRDLEAEDWWFTTTFETEPVAPGERVTLRFGGLATIAEAWLNGEKILASDSMFVASAVDVGARLRATNDLAIRFASLPAAMKAKKGKRPRWRTKLVDKQELRMVRTSLLGRMPSWSPPCPAIGPYREVVLERSSTLAVERASVRTRLEGQDGIIAIDLAVTALTGEVREAHAFTSAAVAPLAVERGEVTRIRGEIRVPDAPLWWPHTHGAQPRVHLAVEIGVGERALRVDLGQVAFRRVEVDERDGAFTLLVNGVRVFCRGACWVPLDVVAFASPAAAYAEALDAARAAGMNMIRVGGTMIYEDDAFYDACDERGILVWQDFQFANLDYPAGDPAFEASVRAEAAGFLDRVETSPALAVLCGGSEVEQQAAMLGLPREAWRSALFAETLPALSREARPDVVYVPNSPTGGVLPFQVNAGVSHYYGVGAYLRPPDDARRAEVRFTAECLAFSNVPCTRTIERTLGDGERPATHPAWKARIPRDRGVGWDFEDVRDHYLAQLFHVDPMRLRYADPERYLALSRVVTGELMLSSIGEWRRRRSSCAGALVWLYRDLWPGAGWGLIDAFGVPKVAYHYAARAMRPTALFLTDEGQSGLYCHVVNDGPAPLAATLEIALYRDGEVQVARGSRRVEAAAHEAIEVPAESLFESFVDSAYAYRFGPPAFDVAIASLATESVHDGAASGPKPRAADGGAGDRVEAFHFPLGFPGDPVRDLGLEATAEPLEGGAYELTVRAARCAYAVSIDAGPFVPDDDAFHLAPGGSRTLRLRPTTEGARFSGSIAALNGRGSARIMVGKGKGSTG
jgi:beta-mannosidase